MLTIIKQKKKVKLLFATSTVQDVSVTLSKLLCFLSRLAAWAFALSTSTIRSSTSPCSLCFVFSKDEHLAFTASMASSASCKRWASFFLSTTNYVGAAIVGFLTQQISHFIKLRCVNSHLASSSSSVRWIASVSYLVLHWATSLLALDMALWSSALASCSSSNCSLSRSQS